MVGKQHNYPGLRLTTALGLGLGLGLGLAYGLSQRRQSRRGLNVEEYEAFIGAEGTIQDFDKLLEEISTKGLDHPLRSELWPLLLGVKRPSSTVEQQLLDYMALKAQYQECIACCQALVKALEESIFHAAQQCSAAAGAAGAAAAGAVHLPHELAQFAEAQRIVIMDAIRTDFEKHAAAAAPSPRTSSSGAAEAQGQQPHWQESFAHLDGALSEQRFQQLASQELQRQHQQHHTVWLSRAALEVLESSTHFSSTNKYQAARLITMLLAYAVHDPDTGYCQGMSDLLVPILLLVEDDVKAFACFCQLMRLARTNFAVDETGIHSQLQALARILQACDAPLHHKLRQLGASHMHFVYRMLVVLLRRDLPMQQVLQLWEMMWAEDLLQGGALSRGPVSLGPNAAMVAAAMGGSSTAASATASSQQQQHMLPNNPQLQASPSALAVINEGADIQQNQPGETWPTTAATEAATASAAAAAAAGSCPDPPGPEDEADSIAAGNAAAGNAAAGIAAEGDAAAGGIAAGGEAGTAAKPAEDQAAAEEALDEPAASRQPASWAQADSRGAPSLLLCFVAAAVIGQRRKVLDDCRDCDDVLRLYNMSRIDFNTCLRKALDVRKTLQQLGQQV